MLVNSLSLCSNKYSVFSLIVQMLSAADARQQGIPFLINLHEDPQLSELIVYPLKKVLGTGRGTSLPSCATRFRVSSLSRLRFALEQGVTKVGTKLAEEKQDIQLNGLGMAKQHAIITHDDDGKVRAGAKALAVTFWLCLDCGLTKSRADESLFLDLV